MSSSGGRGGRLPSGKGKTSVALIPYKIKFIEEDLVNKKIMDPAYMW